MVRAILQQVPHHPHAYTAEMAMRQTAMYLLRHPHRYYRFLEQELLETGESYELYCYNVFQSNIWGDDLIASVFGDMWNISISIVSLISHKALNLFHNEENPEVVIIGNGGSWM